MIAGMSRRGVLGGGVALSALAGAGAVQAAGDLDAELLAAYRRWQPMERERLAINRLADDDPIFEVRSDAYTRPWHDLVDEVGVLPARTPEGLEAKAHVLRALLHNHVGHGTGVCASATPSETLAWSLVTDMLGRAVA